MATAERKFEPALFDPLFDSLVANPTEKQVEIVVEKMKPLMLGPPVLSKKELQKLVKHVIRDRSVWDSKLYPLIAKVFQNFVDMKTPSKSDRLYMRFAISRAAKKCLLVYEPVRSAARKLKMLNEFLKLELLDDNIFLQQAKYLAKKRDVYYFVPLMYEILRNYDELIAEKVVHERKISTELQHYVCYLAAIFRLSGRISDPHLLEIENYLATKCRQWGHTHSAECENLLKLPVPTPLIKAPEALPSATVRLLESLLEKPDKSDSFSNQIRNNLLRASEANLYLHVSGILDKMSEKRPMPSLFSRLLETFRQPLIKSTIGESIKSWVRFTFTSESSSLIDKIWFHNEMCLTGLLPFNIVIDSLAEITDLSSKRGFDMTMRRLRLIYRFLASFDQLLDNGHTFDMATKQSWAKATTLLDNALQKWEFRNAAPEISQFLKSLSEKGGWHLHRKSSNEMDDDVIIVGYIAPVGLANQPSTSRAEMQRLPPTLQTTPVGQSRTKSAENHSIAIMEPRTSKQVHNPTSQPQAGPEICQSHTESSELSVERMKELLKFLDTNPNKADEVGTEMKSKLCASTSKSKFAASVSSLMNELLERSEHSKQLPDASVELLKTLAKASVKMGEEPIFKFSMAVHDWAVKKFQCPPDFEASRKLTEQFWFQTELAKLNLVTFRLYKVYITKTLLLKMTPPSVYFLFRVLREVDHIVDLKAWNLGEDEAPFFTATTCFLSIICSRSDFAEFAQTHSISNHLQLMNQKGWVRNIPTSTGNQNNIAIPPVASTPLPQNSESARAISAEDFGLSIDTVKPYLEMQPPTVFTKRVSEIVEKMFGLINSDETLEAASKLCIQLAKVTSICEKSFISELQENCLNWFSKEYRTDIERMLSNIQREVQTAISLQEKTILTENLDAEMRSYHGKTNQCPRLIAKLFSSGCFAVSFVILFLRRALISTQNKELYRKVFEMLFKVGAEVQKQATLCNLSENFENIFQELADSLNGKTLSNEMKGIIGEILNLKQNGWIVLSPEQRAVNKLNSMFNEVERDPQNFDCIRAHLHGSPSEMCHPFYNILVSKLKESTNKEHALPIKQECVESPPCELCCDCRKRPLPSSEEVAGPSAQRSKRT